MLWRAIKARVKDYVATLRTRRALERLYRREAKTIRQRQAAPDRAEKLLLDYLTPAQRETYWRYGWFVVRGHSGCRYSIWTKDPLYCNVCELGDYGQVVSRMCAHAAINVPMGDHLLTQKLMLEHHEAEFRRVANRL